MPRKNAFCLGLLASLLIHESAAATPVRVDFAGSIDFIDANTQPSSVIEILGPSVAVGAPFSGSFTFNDAEPNTLGGEYRIPVPPWTFQTMLGDVPFTALALPTYQILLITTPGTEPGNVNVFASLTTASQLQASFQIYLKDEFGHPLVSSDLDDVPWDLALFPQRQVTWTVSSQLFPGEFVRVYGTITSLVPEPDLVLLLGMAALALVMHLSARCAESSKT